MLVKMRLFCLNLGGGGRFAGVESEDIVRDTARDECI